MRLNDIQIGTKLELEFYNESNIDVQLRMVSQLEVCENNDIALIAAPIFGGAFYPVHIGTIMNVYFLKDEHLYIFKAKVNSRDKSGNIALLKIERLNDIQKIQRRQFFRFDCIIPIKYMVIEYTEGTNTNPIPFKSAITKDLSGSGLCMMVEESIDENARLECKITLLDSCIQFSGSIIRVSKCEFESKYKYEVAITYNRIDDKDREAIVKYIFNQQRKLREKGLI